MLGFCPFGSDEGGFPFSVPFGGKLSPLGLPLPSGNHCLSETLRLCRTIYIANNIINTVAPMAPGTPTATPTAIPTIEFASVK